MEKINLNGKWKLTGNKYKDQTTKISLDANVPVEAQLALVENGILPKDIYMGKNLKLLEEYEDYEWIYEREFEAPKTNKHVFLVFKGVDCVAEYF